MYIIIIFTETIAKYYNTITNIRQLYFVVTYSQRNTNIGIV